MICYLPMKKDNLSGYINYALIIAQDFLEPVIEDIQSNNKSSLLILKEKNYIKDNEFLLEIYLENFNLEQAYGYFNKPIPITRINKIYHNLKNIEIKNIYFNINVGGKISESLFEKKQFNFLDIKISDLKENIDESKNYLDKLKKFDCLLGALSFSKYSEDKQFCFKEWVECIGIFNNYVFGEFEDVFETEFKKFDKKYLEELNKFQGEFTKTTLKEEIEKQKITVKDEFGDYDINDFIEHDDLYYHAILANFNSNEKTKALIEKIKKGSIKILKSKFGIYLRYGYNLRYSKIDSRDKKGKFDLTLLLDKYIIESLYLYIFENKENIGQLKYIENNIYDADKQNIIYGSGEINNSKFPIFNEIIQIEGKKILNYSDETFKYNGKLINEILEKINKIYSKVLNFIKKNIENLENDKKDLNNKLAEKEKEFQEKIKELAKEKEEKEKKEEEIKNANTNIENLENDKKDLNNKLAEKENIINDLKTNIGNLEKTNNKLKEEIENLNQEKEFQEKLEELAKEKEEKEEEIKNANTKIKNLEEDKINLNNKLDKKENIINDLKTNIGNLEKTNNKLKEEIENLNQEKETKQKSLTQKPRKPRTDKVQQSKSKKKSDDVSGGLFDE